VRYDGVLRYLATAAACASVALLQTAEGHVWSARNDVPISFGVLLLLQGTTWLAYVPIGPHVAAWGLRFGFEWPPRAVSVLAHLGGVVAVVTLFALVVSVTDHYFGFATPRAPFWDHVRTSWVAEAPIGLITYAATVGLGHAAEAGRRSRELARLQVELSRAQLDALRMQVNPHFLFNTLHTIAAFVREQDGRRAVVLIERLGDVLRHVLRTSTELETPLAAELDFLRRYLDIELARFGDRLAVSFAIADDRAVDAIVPQLILQPLVENALRHGLAPRDAPGRLTIAASRDGDMLTLEVRDDGLGLRDDWDTGDGFGLANVRARLAATYGSAGRLALDSPASGGTIATITLPYRTGHD
jgi:two-component system LytT family sensor kinase